MCEAVLIIIFEYGPCPSVFTAHQHLLTEQNILQSFAKTLVDLHRRYQYKCTLCKLVFMTYVKVGNQ